ncbi:MAG: mandelate racemase/muconate lactonizing enzyme family protein [Planctomycetaceae bacterium]|nr:mandelate racemase/muconate lactonizing enzyme family protein [Planctomycetaceae bacterium]
MKIDRIETIHLRFEYADGFLYAGGKCTARVTSLVLVHTDDGRTGVGAVYSHPGLVELVVKKQLEPLLVGDDPTDTETLWWKMYRLTRWYGRKGAAMSALGGIDTACWDLKGQAAGKPVWKLLGGSTPSCPAYASALLWKTPAELGEEAGTLIEKGFRRVKMRLGRGDDYDRPAVLAVRKAIGANNDVMCDGSMRYSLDAARELGKFLAEQRVFWFEEPFEPEAIDDYAALRGTIGIPLAAGENEFGLQGFRELLRAKAVDIVQPDVCRCGGLTEAKRTADLAREFGARVAPHTWSDAATVLANAHLVGSIDHGVTVEVDQTGNPFIEELLEEPLRVVDGRLQLSDAPGLGIRLKQSTLDRYRLSDPDTLPDGSYSDMVFGKKYLV